MVSKLFFLFLFGIFTLHLQAQSIYEVKFKLSEATKDTTTYNAFVMLYEEGGGLLRVRYKDVATSKDIIEEMDLIETPILDKDNTIDSTQTKFTTANLRTISPTKSSNINNSPLQIWFVSTNVNTLQIRSIYRDNNIASTNTNNFLQYNLLTTTTLTRPFLMQYFYPEEDIFNYFFTNKSKGLTAEEKKIKMHLIMVANIEDPSIGKACEKDMRKMVKMYKEICIFLGIQLDTTKIFGRNYSLQTVNNTIKKLNPSKNDIVIFYYSGHGYCNRVPNDPKQFPYLDLRSDPPNQDHRVHTLNIEDVFNTIKSKSARLNLVISDCCNNSVIMPKVEAKKGIGKKDGEMRLLSETNLRALYLNTKRSILITAAKKEQAALTNDEIGSFFTHFFRASMEYHCSIIGKNVTWDQVIKSTKDMVEYKAAHTYCKRPFVAENICQQNLKTIQ